MIKKKHSPYKALAASVNEKDVENAWRAFITAIYPEATFTSPYKCDGFMVAKDLRLLCEFKYDPLLKETKNNLPVIGQAIYYLKAFVDDGAPVPNVVFIGDKNECFVIPATLLMPYTAKAYDWSLSPSGAGKNLQMMADLMKDEQINPYVFDIGEDFNWTGVHGYIERAMRQSKADVPITSATIPKVFEYWRKNVIRSEMPENDHIELFFKVLTNPKDCYKHPKKDGTLVAGDSEVKIDKKGFNGFFSLYKETHNPVEIRELTANKDRLIAEIARRRTGAFFTPSDWVDEAHKMLAEHLGPDYRDEYVFWDCSCGTANLTRDYAFKELYLSTLEQTDLNIIEEAGYNRGAVKFQFDFLNDPMDKIPEGLRKALEEGKKVCFLNNAPYATANNLAFESGKTKNGVAAETMVNKMMKDAKIGASSQQLYAQFMFRIMKIIEGYKLKDAAMANYSMSTFMNGPSFEDFRKTLNLTFIDGMMFQASHFADVADSWGISFTIFKS